ncbi:MAG: hypothetical protein WD801_14555 [Gemmatimonadaceae bacterium]
MFPRSLPLAFALGLALPATVIAQGFEYAAGTGQYRVSSTTAGTQEAMGQTQEFDTSSDQLLTLTVARAHRDTLLVTTVIDSMAAVGPMGMTPPGLDKLIGLRVLARTSPGPTPPRDS